MPLGWGSVCVAKMLGACWLGMCQPQPMMEVGECSFAVGGVSGIGQGCPPWNFGFEPGAWRHHADGRGMQEGREVACDGDLLPMDRQMPLTRVLPQGWPARQTW